MKRETWPWVALTGAGVVTAGGIAWLSFRRSSGPPRGASMDAVPPPPVEPAVLPAHDAAPLPEPGPKFASYPGPKAEALGPVNTQLPSEGVGYIVRNPDRAWGTAPTVAAIEAAARRWAEQSPAFALDHLRVRIADISKRGGGTLPPHKSHHEGRDVDVTLEGVKGEKLSAVALPLLLRVFLEDPAVKTIFLDWDRQAQVWDALEVNPELGPELRQELQYPLAPHTGRTRVRHWPGHRNHLHVRYRA